MVILPPPELLLSQSLANGHHRTPTGPTPGAPLQELIVIPLSARTASEQVSPPGYMLLWLFELCETLPFPSRGGGDAEKAGAWVSSKAHFGTGHARLVSDVYGPFRPLLHLLVVCYHLLGS